MFPTVRGILFNRYKNSLPKGTYRCDLYSTPIWMRLQKVFNFFAVSKCCYYNFSAHTCRGKVQYDIRLVLCSPLRFTYFSSRARLVKIPILFIIPNFAFHHCQQSPMPSCSLSIKTSMLSLVSFYALLGIRILSLFHSCLEHVLLVNQTATTWYIRKQHRRAIVIFPLKDLVCLWVIGLNWISAHCLLVWRFDWNILFLELWNANRYFKVCVVSSMY